MATKKLNAKSTPRDVFFYLLMIITLYAGVISFITLLWQYINVQFPDPLEFYYTGAVNLMRGAIATLVVVWPVFLFMSWLIKKDLLSDKMKQHLWVRRWLLYLTLFIASITMIIDLVSLLNSFLGGELTTRIFLKVLVILVVAVAVFGFYMWELRRDAGKKTPVHVWAGSISTALIIAWVIAGFFIVGSPQQQRRIRFDEQRVSDLQSIQYQVIDYWQAKDALPVSLDDLSDEISGYRAPADPLSGVAYSYQATGELSFSLCATFETDSEETAVTRGAVVDIRYPLKGDESWDHDAGAFCFTRTIDPDLYSIDESVR